jgi:hemerythrin-like domain-containing protein
MTTMEKMTSTAEQVTELLRSEHRHIKEMLTKVIDTKGAARDSAFTALGRFLAAHEAAEETFIHSLEDSAVAQERVHEEQTAGQLIARLEAMDFATEAFERAFAEFANSVKTHADAEEHDELPALTKDASPEELGRIYDALQRVPELAGQQGGPIEAGADFASMLAGAKAEFSTLSSEG